MLLWSKKMKENNDTLIDLPVWSIGFRPFFFSGAIVSTLLILYWALAYFLGDLPSGYFNPIYWHAHEMLYGFVVSIISGFLLTSTASWTQTKPISGKKLKVLFSLWLAGRIAMALSLFKLPISPFVFSFIDLLFIPALAFTLATPLLKSKKLKNLQFIPILSILAIGNLLVHLSSLEIIDAKFASKGIYLGLNLILIIMVTISGRVIPIFTANAIPGLQPKTRQWVEWLVLISVWLYVLLDFSNLPTLTGIVAGVCGILSLIRLSGWRGLKTLSNPLLWILHLGYLWIAVGFILVFLSDVLGILPRSAAIHAFTAGAMGTFIIGMMSRVSLGHTGRALKLKKWFVASYILVTLSAVVRIAFAFFPNVYSHGILCAGILWAAGFLLFLVYYTHILLTPRPDGKLG
jgi:uncharacterized protein involved in response to NO